MFVLVSVLTLFICSSNSQDCRDYECVLGDEPDGGVYDGDGYLTGLQNTSPYVTPDDKKLGGDQCGGSSGMARYSAHAMAMSLNIEDTPIRYAPPRGPAMNFTVTYNQKDDEQPHAPNYSNLSHNWTHNWLSYVTDDPNNPSANARIYVRGGGAEIVTGFNSATQSYTADPQSMTVLYRTGPASYERRFPNGAKEVFTLSDGATAFPRKIFMTSVVDAAANAATITYDGSLRITAITDALGRALRLSYELSSDSLKITRVTEPFPTGRSAAFTYDGNGRLVTITDVIGIQPRFTYATDGTNFINSLTTPYGTSNFRTDYSTFLEMTDPLGGKERLQGGAGSIGSYTNYWNKRATAMYPPDSNGNYDSTKAQHNYFLGNPDGTISGIVGSEQKPLESWVKYAYSGQSDVNHIGTSANPTQVSRVLDDGTTQLWQYEYNSIGKVTKATDPIGRVTSYAYDTNNIDLLTVYQKKPSGVSTDPTGAAADKIASYTYNSVHEPLTSTDASGQATTYTYNSYGQVTSVQNARGETTTYLYGDGSSVPRGYLASITGPQYNGASTVTSFTYDAANRVRTVTNSPDNYAVTTDYDNLDRPTKITYPDGTYKQILYTEYTDHDTGVMTLDATQIRDRRGRWTYKHYNSNEQLEKITDPLGRVTRYDWCSCGSLADIIDPRGKMTTFQRDLQGRVTSKVFADGEGISYVYESSTSRLKSMETHSTTNYQYFIDNNLQQISYVGTDPVTSIDPLGLIVPPTSDTTPTVSFTYDPNYNRVASMTDGIGTTTYAYYPITSSSALGAGQLQSVNGPLNNNTITYTYDELGRPLNDGTSVLTYDSLGRISATDNALGHFSRIYDGVTSRPQMVTYPNGQSTNYTYFGNANDRRLQSLQNLAMGGVSPIRFNYTLSRFDYTYDAKGQISTWAKQIAPTIPNVIPSNVTPSITGTYTYDLADQITSAANATVTQPGNYSYGYDLAGNRTNDSVGTGTHTFNDDNQTQDVGYTYDYSGDLSSDGTSAYEWDDAGRLVAITAIASTSGQNSVGLPVNPPLSPSAPTLLTRSEFSYDGLGRRVRIVQKQASGMNAVDPSSWSTVSDNRYVWNGNTPVEERDSTGTHVTKRFFAEGEQINGVNYYFTRDHLGSVREMTDAAGTVHAQYEYDPFGNRTKLRGDLDADFGFTGHYYHKPSGLHLSLHRPYSSTLGRWLSRDPLENAEMSQGPNLYSYVRNNSINATDPLGLCPGDWLDPRTWFNEGLVDSLGDTAASISDVWGDWWYGNNWNYARDAGYGPLGQVENNPGAYATEWGLISVSGAATAIAVIADAAENVRITGPSEGFLQHGEGRIIGLLYGDVPVLGLDYHPVPGSGDQPVLHLNVGPSGFHIPLYDSRYPTFLSGH